MTDRKLMQWTPDMVKAFWDYESNFPKRFFTYSRRHTMIRRLGQYIPKAGTVLDYGCGPGNLIGPLLAGGFRVAGLDSSPSTREAVRKSFGDCPGFLGVFDQEGVEESGLQFDVIIAAEVIEHLYDDQLDGLLETLKCLSHSETHIVLTTPNEERLEDCYILCPVTGELFHRWQHVRNWSESSLRKYLAQRGFADARTFTTDFDATLVIRGKHNPARLRWWSAARERVRYLLQPRRKRPHLVAVTKVAPQGLRNP
jgi:2-polyprenyl-3-methyl-5-hydroxy-6-metoxy-1,4-benzoquinol methylase